MKQNKRIRREDNLRNIKKHEENKNEKKKKAREGKRHDTLIITQKGETKHGERSKQKKRKKDTKKGKTTT